MSAVTLYGLAASLSLLAGWRLYLTVFVTGLAVRMGWIGGAGLGHGLDSFANPWVMGIAALGALADFFADKVMWVDSLWDGLHTLVRPVGGALIALTIIRPADPAVQLGVLMLGGSAALLTHGAKAGTRAALNTLPEPFTNIAASGTEDVVSGGLLWLVLAHPALGAVVALTVALLAAGIIMLGLRLVRRITDAAAGAPADRPAAGPS